MFYIYFYAPRGIKIKFQRLLEPESENSCSIFLPRRDMFRCYDAMRFRAKISKLSNFFFFETEKIEILHKSRLFIHISTFFLHWDMSEILRQISLVTSLRISCYWSLLVSLHIVIRCDIVSNIAVFLLAYNRHVKLAARWPHAARLLLKCGPQLSFRPSKCLKLTYFNTKRLSNRNKITKLRPNDYFSVFECYCAARTWVWVWHAWHIRS